MIPMPMLPMMPLQVLGLDMNALIQYKDHMQSLQDLGFRDLESTIEAL